MKHLILRRAGQNSLQVIIPFAYVCELGLQPGDTCLWSAEGNEAKLKFLRITELFNATREPEAQAKQVPQPQNAA